MQCVCDRYPYGSHDAFTTYLILFEVEREAM